MRYDTFGGEQMMQKFFRVMLCLLLMITMTAVAPAGITASAAKNASTMKIMRTNVESGRLRKGPSSAYDVITTLDKGEKVFYAGKTKNAFSYVCTEKGKIGYIYSGFLSNYGSVRTSSIYYTRAKNVRLYKKPSTSASRVATLRNQQFIIVYQKAGNWAQVRTLDGKAGYMQLSKIKATNW